MTGRVRDYFARGDVAPVQISPRGRAAGIPSRCDPRPTGRPPQVRHQLPGHGQRFGYDLFGNGWNEENQKGNGIRFVGKNWYLSGSNVTSHLNNMEYDGAGNLRQLEPSNALSPIANYDGEGCIYELGTRAYANPTAPVTPVAQYSYNGDGQRVKRAVSGTTTYYLFGVEGTVAQEYTGGTVPVAARQNLVSDHLGSTRLVLDGTTLATVAGYDYEPFGSQIARIGEGYDTAPAAMRLLFTGKERDSETAGGVNPLGLDYFGARYYAAAQGRFTSPDPGDVGALLSSPSTWNMYAYVGNNPLTYIDPRGLCSKSADGDYLDDDKSGTFLFKGPCVQGNTATATAPKVRDLLAEAQAEQIRVQYEIMRRTQEQNSPKPDVPLSPSGQQAISAITNAAPTTCGGRVFGYIGAAGGKPVKGLELEGFLSYLGEYDSNTGWSNNFLVEGGVVGGHGAPAYTGSSGGVAVNARHFEPLFFAPGAGFAGLVGSPSGAGFYLGTSVVGVGAYVNITSNAACNEITRRH